MVLRIADYLADVQEFDGVALSAKFRCPCGSEKFYFSYAGKQTKGILSPWLVKKDGRLILKARCANCQQSTVVYNSTEDGSHPKKSKSSEELHAFESFVHPKTGKKELSVVVKYNYYAEKFKYENQYSSEFENCFIYLLDDGNEGKALLEE